MKIDIIAAVPELLQGPFSHSILKRANEKGLLEINLIDLRDYGLGQYKQIDDYAFGGGAGMVLMAEPLVNCIEKLKSQSKYDEIVYLSPDGKTLTQQTANKLSLKDNLLLICGHYKGIDQRVRDHWITMEISIGDYVLRLIPGVLNDETSALTDSFQDKLLAPPVYTRPADFRGYPVPEILLSGHAKNIEEWRQEESFKKTKTLRPDLLEE